MKQLFLYQRFRPLTLSLRSLFRNTMLHSLLILLPFTQITLPLPPFPNHRTCESSGLEAPYFPLQTSRAHPVSKKFLPKWKTGILEKIFANNEVFVEDLAKKSSCQQNVYSIFVNCTMGSFELGIVYGT